MLKKDLRLLWLFTLRIMMYTGKEDPYTIMAFLNGYELGRDNECNFIDQLSNSIKEDYKVDIKALGLQNQIQTVADKQNTDWVTIFKKQSLKIIVKKLNVNEMADFVDSLKKRINGKMEGGKNHFCRNWITDWYGIVDLKSNWFNDIWSIKEFEILTRINDEIRVFGIVQNIDEDIKPTSNLLSLCSEMQKEMNKL